MTTGSGDRAVRMNRSVLIRYIVAATCARAADGGAAVGLILLAVSVGPTAARGAAVGGVLAACLTAPHLLGPWAARLLDRARDQRWVLAAACTGYAVALAAGALLLGHAAVPVVALGVAVAGACGPLLTGGLSSVLVPITGGDERDQHRAEGWDAFTYGLGGTLGPTAVAAAAAAASPLVALVALAGLALVAAGVVLTLPRTARDVGVAERAVSVRGALRLMVISGPLRRVAIASLVAACSMGAMSVIPVLLGPALNGRPGSGATLAAAFGLGNLVGSLLVTARPLTGEPEVGTLRGAVVLGLALIVCAVVGEYALALVAFALAGACNAPFFTATLAARSLYSPEEARAQVFVTMAGGKVALSSLGSAAAGAAAGFGPRSLLVAAAVLIFVGAAVTYVDRRSTRSPVR